MKRILLFFLFSMSVIISMAQLPSFPYQGNSSTGFGQNSIIGSKIGFQYAYSFTDTTAANNYQVPSSSVGFLKNMAGVAIRCGDDIYIRSNDLQYWIKQAAGTLSTYYNLNIGSGYRFAVPNTNNIKTLFSAWGITLDSTTNTNGITVKADSSTFKNVFWSRNGNAATTPPNDFIGTTDAKGLMFKTNGIQAAFLDYALGNASFGYQSMINNTSGSNNTASGILSLFSNVSGNHNTAIGEQSLYSMTSGEKNIGIGYSAGKYYISPSNKLFIDGLDRADSAGTRNKSLLYGEFNATAASQKLYVNGQFYLPYIASGAGTKVMRVNPGTGYATYSDTTISESYLGSIYSATSWATLGAFTNAGSTSSVVSNKIQFSGGANTYTQTLGLTPATNIEHWKMSAKVKVGTKDATSYGFGLGVRSTNNTNQSNEVGIFDMTSSGGTVSLAMGGGYTGVGNTSTALTFSVNDYIILTVERNIDEFIVTATNSTTGGSLSQTYYRYTPALSTTTQPNNTGRFSIYSLGGTFTIDSLAVESYETKNALFAVEGDSKAWGYNLAAYDNRFGDLLKKSFKSTIVQGGSGDKTIDLSGRLQEVINLSPQNVLLAIGSNDIRTGVPYATYTARYDSIVTALTAAGINVYHLLTFPEGTGGIDVSPLVGYISATYAANRIIDTYNPINNARRSYIQSDSIHLNDAGNNLVYNLIFSSNLFSAGTADPYKHFNSMGSGNTGDISRFNTSTTTAVGIYNNNGLRNTLISGDAPLTTATDFEMKTGTNYYLTQAGTLRLQVSAGVLSVIGDGDHTFAYGSSGEYHIKTSQTASNELTAGPWTGSTNANTVIVPAINGTNGAKTQLGYFGSGGWMEGLSLSNNTGYATTNMLLMKSGGNVGIGTSAPTAKLHINGSVNINKDSLAITTGKKWKVYIDTVTNILVRDSTDYLPLVGAAYTTTTGDGLALTTSTLTTGNLMKLTNTSTVNNGAGLLSIVSSGANSTASKTTYGQQISMTNTGTTSTNVGLSVTASGATNNYAALFTGNVGIGTTSPDSTLTVSGSGRFSTNIKVGSATAGDKTFIFQEGLTQTATSFKVYRGDGTAYILGNSANSKISIYDGSNSNVMEVGFYGMGLRAAAGIRYGDNNTGTYTASINRIRDKWIGIGNGSLADSTGSLTLDTLRVKSSTTIGGTLGVTGNGAVSTPTISGTGTWYSGGSATTTKPYLLIQPTGTTSTGWNTSGTGLGVNAASGFTGYFQDWQLNGVSKAYIRYDGFINTTNQIVAAGNVTGANIGAGAGNYIYWQSRSIMQSPSDGVIQLSNQATSDFTRLQFGGSTSSFPSIARNGTGIDIKLADNSAYTGIQSLYDRFGSGSPESVVTAPVGAVYHRTDGGAGTSFYVKESGSGNTGWVAK